MTRDQEEAHENVRIAEQIDAWQSGPVWAYVLKLKEGIERRIIEEFRTVDVTNVKKTKLLQEALNQCTVSPKWLDDAVRAGIHYEQILKAEKGEYDE